MNNTTTRRYPRTIEEAFGPYATANFEQDKNWTRDRLTVFMAAFFIVFSSAILFMALK